MDFLFFVILWLQIALISKNNLIELCKFKIKWG